jgi:hypothetical protein
MYKIIGANQVEYGPITADQLRQWITEGRVNAQTLVQPEGATDWRPLSQFPEFAPNFAPAPPAMPAFGAPIADEAGRAQALSAVTGPAIGLIVTAALGFLGAITGLVLTLTGSTMRTFNSGNPQMDNFFRSLNTGSGMVRIIAALVLSGVVLYGALKMKKLENHGLAMGVSILAMIPCISPCCLVGLPFGIWALIVLNKPEVKGYFS